MRIRIITVGKLKEQYIRDGVEEYLTRLKRYCPVSVLEVKDEKQLLGRANGYVIALHPAGKELSSEGFAALLKDKTDVSFLIGGAEGLPEGVLTAADMQLSLSKLTFQHDLAQLVLAEQLYRAFTILKKHPYHK